MPDSLAALGGHGRFYRDLTFVNRDGLACVLAHLNHLVTWEYLKMYPATKQQLMWLIQQFVRSSVVGMDTVCWNLMRQVAGGDVSKNNLWLADILVSTTKKHINFPLRTCSCFIQGGSKLTETSRIRPSVRSTLWKSY